MKKTKMLKKNYEFKRVLTKGKYYSGKCIEAFIKQNYNDLNFIGIAVSSKAGNAVKRNYVKRIIRAGYTELEGKIKKGYSIVFLWKKKVQIEKAKYNDVFEDIEKIIEKAGILKE